MGKIQKCTDTPLIAITCVGVVEGWPLVLGEVDVVLPAVSSDQASQAEQPASTQGEAGAGGGHTRKKGMFVFQSIIYSSTSNKQRLKMILILYV